MRYLHHIIPKHEWKKRFGILRGFSALDNTVWLSLEQHIQAHQLLFEINGHEGDRIAFRGMSGMIGAEEIHRQKRSFANIGNTHALGYKFNEADCKQRSERLRGNKFALGLKRVPWTEERKKQKTHYNWQFVFLGANIDAFAEGSKYGFAVNSTMQYTPTANGVFTKYAAVMCSVSNYRSGVTADVDLTNKTV